MKRRLTLDDPLYVSIKDEVDKHPTTGLEFCELVEKLGRHPATIQYRIREMERLGLVRLERARSYLKIYPADKVVA